MLQQQRKIGIVGGGISGLLACKYALSKGYDPIVYESQTSTGGLWTKTFESTRLQTPAPAFSFTDFPWPSSVKDMFPKGEQVLEYIQSYAEHFDLIKYVRFNCKVVSIDYEGHTEEEMEKWDLWGGNGEGFGSGGKWSLQVIDLRSGSIEVMVADFVVLCVGRFSGEPKVPEFPSGKGPEIFSGKVMHSMEYAELDNQRARDLIKGKRVVVVGGLKSALDIAMECAIANDKENPCTMIIRNPCWTIPDYFPWKVPIAFMYLNRFSELLVHKPGEGLILSIVATILSPLRWAFSKIVESDVKYRHKIQRYGMVPDHNFHEGLTSCVVAITPEGFYQSIEKEEIILKKAKSFKFYEGGIVLENEEKHVDHQKLIRADLVIFATGFKGEKKLKEIFGSTQFQDYIMGAPDCSLPLYRQCIHPHIPQLAVIGYSESVANLYTSEMRSRWLMELLDGTFKLPRIKEMELEIYKWDKFFKTYSPKHYRRAAIGTIHHWYNDQLCRDMGWNPQRKRSFIADLFLPYSPMDYARE